MNQTVATNLRNSTSGDNNEQLTFGAASLTYDHFGNTTAIGSDAFTWDFEGHMLTATHSSSVDTHEYNGDGQRMRSKLNNASDWTNFINDPLEDGYPAILVEYTLISSTFTLKSVNTHGIGLINTNREGTKRYFHFDGLGSTWALTDSSEVVQDTYISSAFGIQEASTGSSVNPFRYVGHSGYYDDGSRGSPLALTLLGVRYYSPEFGRFLSWDPEPDDSALYCYAYNNPAMMVDPDGRIPIAPILIWGGRFVIRLLIRRRRTPPRWYRQRRIPRFRNCKSAYGACKLLAAHRPAGMLEWEWYDMCIKCFWRCQTGKGMLEWYRLGCNFWERIWY